MSHVCFQGGRTLYSEPAFATQARPVSDADGKTAGRRPLEGRHGGLSFSAAVRRRRALELAKALRAHGVESVFLVAISQGRPPTKSTRNFRFTDSLRAGRPGDGVRPAPAICTRIPGVTQDIIDDGEDGIILDQRDAADLARAILRVKEDGTFGKKLSANAIEKVRRKFSLADVTRRHVDLYRGLLYPAGQ
jgi:glycosyltransferase involved in cell wall biosynthesis